MTTADEVRDELLGAVDSLHWQSKDAVDLLVLPNWGGEKHGYDRLLFGVVMNVMSLADRFSTYVAGSHKHQAIRLRTLFQSMGSTPEAAAVAVQAWRHTLMHTGLPVHIRDRASGVEYALLLHWGEEHLRRPQHMTVIDYPGGRILNFGALYAVEDLREHATRFFRSIADDAARLQAVVLAHTMLARAQSVRL